ncbi:MAG: hypothetical protein NVSMB10_10620 [Steroidobacteraceae bacterium]
MKLNYVPAMLLAVAAMGGSIAVADDTPTDRPVKTQGQLMDECMARHRHDGAGSQKDLKKTCEAELKSFENHPSAPTPAQAPASH